MVPFRIQDLQLNKPRVKHEMLTVTNQNISENAVSVIQGVHEAKALISESSKRVFGRLESNYGILDRTKLSDISHCLVISSMLCN